MEDAAWGSRKQRWVPEPTKRMANSANQLNAGDLCVVSVNEHVSVVGFTDSQQSILAGRTV